MNLYNGIRFQHGIFLLALCLSISGCASFPNKEFPTYTITQLQPLPNKPSMDYDVRSYTMSYTLKDEWNYYKITEETFEKHVDKNFEQSNLFSKFNSGIGGADYHSSFSMDMRHHFIINFVTAIFSACSLAILPAYNKIDYTLCVKVDKGGEFFKRYEYHHDVTTWSELFLIFWAPSHWPLEVKYQALDQMLIAFLHDFQQDIVMEHAGQP